MSLSHYNPTTYAILGLLTIGCRTGYDMKRMIDTSLAHFWKISYGQIYPTLKKLVEDELVIREQKLETKKPERVEYYLTAEGERLLNDWLYQPVEKFPGEKNEVLLRLFLSADVDNHVTIQQLEKYREAQLHRLQMYHLIEDNLLKKTSNEEQHRGLLAIDFGKRMANTVVEWCDDTINKLH